MQKVRMILAVSLLVCSASKLVAQEAAKIQWMPVNEVQALLKQNSKPVLVDLYTDWCHWCKVMDKKTYSNAKVIAYLQENFYIAKVNAESKETFTWKNKVYQYNQPNKINDFALYLSNGQASFPTTVIIPDENTPPIPIPGFMEPKELEVIVKYFGEGAYKTKTFPEFQKTFRSTWK